MKIKSFVEKAELRRRLVAALREDMLVEPKDATIEQFYRALASTLRDLMGEKRRHFRPGPLSTRKNRSII